MNRPPERPPSIPDHYVLAPCVMCKTPTWYDPQARRDARKLGLDFGVVCSPMCAIDRSAQHKPRKPGGP